MIKINLACGNMPLPKPWKNIDKYYYPGHEEMNRADGDPKDFDWEQGDFTDLSRFGEDSVDMINLCHGLEHTYWYGAIQTLQEIYRVLKHGGKVEIEVPDLKSAFNFDTETMIDLVYGGRDENTILLGHHCGFTRQMLQNLMEAIGFKNVRETEVGFGTSKPESDRNFRLIGEKI